MSLSTENFSKNISELIEFDYGDFMRQANYYLNRMRDELSVLHDKDINSRLSTMQTYLQYAPEGGIEYTRERLLNDTRYIEDLLRGHQQDWESAI